MMRNAYRTAISYSTCLYRTPAVYSLTHKARLTKPPGSARSPAWGQAGEQPRTATNRTDALILTPPPPRALYFIRDGREGSFYFQQLRRAAFHRVALYPLRRWAPRAPAALPHGKRKKKL